MIQDFHDRRRHERREAALAGWRALGKQAKRTRDRRGQFERARISGWVARFDAARVNSWDANGNRTMDKAENIRIPKYDL